MRGLPFFDRIEAARRLAERLAVYRDADALVLAIPRGAAPMGRVIADALHADLDVVLVRKLGAPGNPELAIGAVDESGTMHVAEYASLAGADGNYLECERGRQLQRIREQRRRYSRERAPIDPAGRVVIVVDDGLATGETMVAALAAVRRQAPARLVCAVPVASADALARVRSFADDVVCLHVPQHFDGVGAFYLRFDQVEDEDVVAALR
ncbi:phosphoribosyltransferase [Dyella ginsengisoli]|uniref:phosphoribosyltransferase n=1 Tax=Dyella ginsengisoli TaxID=363848 RepID=UPI00034677AD|nr:phosphoribosyltransferase family protein [Dyella ginsengisoli]